MIAIYEDTGGDMNPDEFTPTALYDDGEWVAGGDEWKPYYPPGTPEAEITSQLDGPTSVAVEVTEGPDELIRQIEKTIGDGIDEGETTSEIDRENDGHDEESAPPWATSKAERQSSIGPTQATLLGVGDEVTVFGDDEDENPDRDANFSDREKDDGRVVVESVDNVPDDKVAQVEVDDEGDPEEVYYEP